VEFYAECLGSHSHRLRDVESDKVITATHVTFDEHARSCPDNSFVGENVANTSNKSSCDCKQNNKDSDDLTNVTVKPHIALDDQDEDAKPDPDDQDIDSNSDENFENAMMRA
jgi:hypothetical protein